MIKAGFKYFSIICALAINFSYAQKNNVESLHIKFKIQKNDTNKVNQLNKLALDYKDSKLDSSILLSTQALMLSQELKWKKGEAISEKQIGVFYYYKMNYSTSLLHFNKSLVNCENLIKSNDDHDRLFGEQLQGKVFGNIASTYSSLNDYYKAINYFEKSLVIAKKGGNKRSVAVSLLNLSSTYFSLGNYTKALECDLRSLKISDSLKDKELLCKLYNEIGILYISQKEYNRGLDFLSRGLKMAEELGDRSSAASLVANIGHIYFNRGRYEKALQFFFRAIDIERETADTSGIDSMYDAIANAYNEQNKHVLAEKYYEKSIAFAISTSDSHELALSLANLGNLHSNLKRYREAINSLNKALIISRQIGVKYVERGVEENLADLYEKMHNSKLALKHYKKFIQLRDSLFSQESSTKISRMSINYDYEKQKEIDDLKNKSELEKQKLVAEADSKRQKTIICAVAFVLFLAMVFSAFMFKSLNVTRQQKKIIEDKNIITEEQKQHIEDKHKEITDSINYAERIQRSFLATKESLDEYLKDYFVLFHPKDVVSGDFYWASCKKGTNVNNQRNLFYLVTADSTGHGVPGAIMSILNIFSLEKALEQDLIEPADILNYSRKTIIERLKKDGSKEGGKDGMDASLVCFEFDSIVDRKIKMIYAAANNPIWIVRQLESDAATTCELIELKPDRMPVGKHEKQWLSFTQHEFELNKGDIIYTLTDGLCDQFGGPDGKKFMSKRLKQLLLSINDLSMCQQKEAILNELHRWKGSIEQVDDISLIGIRV
jgi:tetratricopeptide (TPR) repeat protein